MIQLSKRMQIVSSIGHAVLFSLALVGGVRIVGGLLGQPISSPMAGNIFAISCLLTAPFAAYFNIAQIFVGEMPANGKEM